MTSVYPRCHHAGNHTVKAATIDIVISTFSVEVNWYKMWCSSLFVFLAGWYSGALMRFRQYVLFNTLHHTSVFNSFKAAVSTWPSWPCCYTYVFCMRPYSTDEGLRTLVTRNHSCWYKNRSKTWSFRFVNRSSADNQFTSTLCILGLYSCFFVLYIFFSTPMLFLVFTYKFSDICLCAIFKSRELGLVCVCLRVRV